MVAFFLTTTILENLVDVNSRYNTKTQTNIYTFRGLIDVTIVFFWNKRYYSLSKRLRDFTRFLKASKLAVAISKNTY